MNFKNLHGAINIMCNIFAISNVFWSNVEHAPLLKPAVFFHFSFL